MAEVEPQKRLVNARFHVHVDTQLTQEGRYVCILGNVNELGAWNIARGVPLQRVDASSTEWAATIRVPPHVALAYKYAVASVSGADAHRTLHLWESLPGNRTLVAGATNVALNKPAEQSSTFVAIAPPVLGPRLPSLAVNGNTAGHLESHCARTKREVNPWWQVDLGAATAVSSIVLWNRQHLAVDELFPVWVFISSAPLHQCSLDEAKARSTVHHRLDASMASDDLRSVVWSLSTPATGQYVRVQCGGDLPQTLQLAQVQVLVAHDDSVVTEQRDGWFGLDTRDLGDCQFHVENYWLDPTASETRLLFGNSSLQRAITLYDRPDDDTVRVTVRVPGASQPAMRSRSCRLDPVDTSAPLTHLHHKLLGNCLDQSSVVVAPTSALGVAAVQQISIFKTLSEAALTDVVAAFESIEFTDGQEVVIVGRPRRYLYLVDAGTLQVCGEPTTQGHHVYLTLPAGSYLGELALISGANRRVHIVSNGTTKCRRLHRQDFLAILARHGIPPESLLEEHAAYVVKNAPSSLDLTGTKAASPAPLHPQSLQVVAIAGPTPFHILVDVFHHATNTIVGTCILARSQLPHTSGTVSSPILAPNSHEVVGEGHFGYLHVRGHAHASNSIAHSRTFLSPDGAALDIGHRGLGRSYYQKLGHRVSWIRENTLPSFIVAGYLGADLIEFDVQLSKDRVPIVYHDYFFSGKLGHRASGATLFTKMGLHDLTLEQLNRIEWRHCVQKPSRFRELVKKHWRAILGKPAAPPLGVRQPSPPRSPSSFQRLCDLFPTLRMTFEHVPLYVGFNIEIKYPMETHESILCTLPAFELNAYVDAILDVVWTYGRTRSIVFSCFAPDVCVLLRAKQTRYPVFFLTCGTNIKEYVWDTRCIALEHAVAFSRMENFQGIVTNSDPLLETPALVPAIKNQDLRVYTWGDQNTGHAPAQKQKMHGVDAVISDNVGDLTRLDEKILPRDKRSTLAP
ncbi:Aste57867_24370 [Aphanomyces stellatus]|uniref:Aste57867_24370 protein n=1 Tax=Aphanomyces stellatus TaxID=120398 RepID=A0A485LQ90_9STRA|nr:hypothetical protein As57867_024294 [Aphanomyces stellatus]VFU01010.1 Aste57867_24370 [Aphanomyces stellatus]